MSRPREAGALSRITQRFMDEGFFRGAVIRVERGGRVLYEEARGYALQTEDEQRVIETTTLFDIASVSKLFTATAVLRLITMGKLRLDAGAADVIGAGMEIDEHLRSRLRASLAGVDVAALLTHSSGIHSWYPFYARRGEPFETVLADLLESRPRRTEVIYSDINFMILGRLIECVTGQRLADAVGALVLGPLGLGRSSYGRPLGPAAATETGNRIERRMVSELGLSFEGWRDESEPILGEADDGNCHYYFHGAAGHAGVFSDARDLCRLGRLFLDGGCIDGGRTTSRTASANFLAPVLVADAMRDHGGGRGLGFQLGEIYPRGGCGHTGFTGTLLHVNTATGLAIAILTNRLHVPEPRDISPYRREISTAVLEAFP